MARLVNQGDLLPDSMILQVWPSTLCPQYGLAAKDFSLEGFLLLPCEDALLPWEHAREPLSRHKPLWWL